MEKLLGILAKVMKAIGAVTTALAAARARYSRLHKIAEKAHDRSVVLTRKAEEAAAAGKLRRARRFRRRAFAKKRRSLAASGRAQAAVGEIKELGQRKHDLKVRADELQEELAKLKAANKVTISGNKATGGTKRERLKTVALASATACASGRRPNFYSQGGFWDVDHAITGEARNARSDCSSWVTSIYKACGLPDPNGNRYGGGFTGTLGTHGRSIPRSELKPGDLILYGTAPFHHVEMYVGPGQKTIGHGSAPVDAGIVDLIPGPKSYRTYV